MTLRRCADFHLCRDDEVGLLATVKGACRGISGETGTEARGKEMFYDASDLLLFSWSELLILAKTELVFLFWSSDMFLLYVFRDTSHL